MKTLPSVNANDEGSLRIRFGRFEADLEANELLADGCPVDIQPQPLRLLMHLIRYRQRVVSKQELREEMFDERQISAAALTRAVMKARQAIGDADATRVATVARVGYRFVAGVDENGLENADSLEGISLAFLPFKTATDNATGAWAAAGLPSLVGDILANDRRITLVTMPSVIAAVAGASRNDNLPERIARAQRATGAAALVHGVVVSVPGGLRVDFRLFAGRQVATGSVSGSLPVDLAVGMAKALSRHLGCTIDYAAAAAALPQDPLAAEAYFRGRQASDDQRYESALHLYRLAHDLEPSHTATALRLLRELSWRPETTAEAGELAARLMGAAEAAGDRATMVRVQYCLAMGHIERLQPQDATADLSRLIELADGREGAMFWGDVHHWLAIVAHTSSRFDEAREQLAHSRRHYRKAGDRTKLIWLLAYEAGLVDADAGLELVLEAARGARELGLPATLAAACTNACVLLFRLGRLAESVSHGAEGFAAAVSVGDRGFADQLALCSAYACRLAGWPAVAARILADLDALPGAPRRASLVSLARGLWHGSRGEWLQAASCTGQALEGAGFTLLRADILPWHAEALMFSGRPEEAQAVMDGADPSVQEIHEYLVHRLLMRAALAHRRGEPGTALDLLGEALALGPEPVWHAWACVDAAWLHAEAGRSTEAEHLLAQIGAHAAALPAVIAAKARVRHAAGDVHGALALHRQYEAARQEPSWNEYFSQLGAEYQRQSHDGIRSLPPAPCLPGRSC